MYSLSSSVLVSYTEYGAAILNIDTGTYFMLNETGADIIKLLSESLPSAVVVERIAEIYDAPIMEIERDVRNILDELMQNGLVEPKTIS
ncbi:PqqD family peptide modification chaperone (plasmid) [Rhodococcus ruber]|nr:PqqD family peptide modification chaperone [Rhodococcus ruber]